MKPFDPQLYADNDPAKDYIVEWLRSKGYEAEVNPDQYGIDLLVTKERQTSGIEIEVKHNWRGYLFPYRTVHIAARKRKFFDDDNYLMMLNSDWSSGLLFTAEEIRKATIIVKHTKLTEAESFIEIPTKTARHYILR